MDKRKKQIVLLTGNASNTENITNLLTEMILSIVMLTKIENQMKMIILSVLYMEQKK